MLTRFSSYFLRTLREDPSDAEAISHKLLVRAGYIRRQSPGIFAWLPLGLRVKARIEQIIREEMTAAGAHEVHFPALLPKEPYEVTGRWTEYRDELFRLQDRRDAWYLLAPTHEEVFTLLVKDLYSSYKDLPLTIYQIQDKYRDEARPRAGLLRGREFTMKDAYSFDMTDEGLDASYTAQRDAYERIFARLGLDYVIVKADAGAMGGSRSEEFLHPTAIGEDTFVRSAGGYAANVEAYDTLAPAEPSSADLPAPTVVETPDSRTIQELIEVANSVHPKHGGERWHAQDTLKNVVLALAHLDGTRELVIVGVPGDRDVDLKRAEIAFAPAEVEAATDDDFRAHPELVRGYIGPWSLTGAVLGAQSATGIRYFVDPRVVSGSQWITGANRNEHHVFDLVAGRDFGWDDVVDVADVRAGDPAPDGSGPIELTRGTEIAHVFQLGRKYAEALGLRVLDADGKLATVTMGSYGIGVTRVLAIIAEENNDDRGLIWPESVSPFDVQVVAAGREQVVFDAAEAAALQLEAAGFDVFYDDREKVSPGVKFGDAELIGVPWVIVAGRDAAEGKGELWDRRRGEKSVIVLSDAAAELVSRREHR